MIKVLSNIKHFTLLFFILSALVSSSCSFKSKNEPPLTLHLVSEQKIKGLDPIYTDDLYSGMQSSQAYEGLLQYHYLKRPYVLEPNLAESLPTISANRLVYTFHLKKGVLFQDDPCFQETRGKGREMTAEDVLFSLKRLADPKLTSPGWWILDEKITGLNAWRDAASKVPQTDYSTPIEGLSVVDRYTVRIQLVKPSTQFIYGFAMPYTGIVPHEAVEFYGKELINHAVGTGPFRLLEYNPNSRIVWQKNPTYRNEFYPSEGAPGDVEAGLNSDAGKPLPLSDRVVVNVMVERQPMWLNFLAGKIDFAMIPKDNFASVITEKQELASDLAKKGIRLTKSPGLDVTHAAFNMSDSLLGKNKYLRQALSLAFDEKTYIELFYNGRAIPAQGPIPPGISGYDPKLKNPFREFNIIKAKELLAKAGFPGGKGLPVIEWGTIATSDGRQSAEYAEKMMAVIGVKLRVNNYSWPQFQESIKNKKMQMWEYAWQADYPDAENFLQLFFSKNGSPGSNDANYSNPVFDRLYEKLLTLNHATERNETYKKMIEILIEDCPWIFGAHRITYTLVQPWLKNYKPMDFDHSRYKYYRIEPSLKK